MAGTPDMQTFAARLATFQQPHQLSKRRASGQSGKKKAVTTAEWPHERPQPEELARAGFFYRPAQDSLDNVQCFLCAVKLDGWEAEDAPLGEHIAHSDACAWAVSLSTMRLEGDRSEEGRDPLCEALVAARQGTFHAGEGWPHEGKRGWRCKVGKMVEAGWSFDPSPETEDGVTCFYCNLSLDGWEPKDDPFEEHRRRGPECAFFELLERWHGEVGGGRGKGRKGRGRASKGSRVSTQSAVSMFSEAPSTADLGDSITVAGVDDSIVSTATTASQATGKSRKKAGGRKGAAAKGRKKAKTPSPSPEPVYEQRLSEVSAQLQEELELSIDHEEPENESTPQEKPGKRGVKRTSAGVRKELDSSVLGVEFPAPPQPAAAGKAKRGRKVSAAQPPPLSHVIAEEAVLEELVDEQPEEDVEALAPVERSPEPEVEEPEIEKPKKAAKSKIGAGAAGKKGRARKASSSVRSSKAATLAAAAAQEADAEAEAEEDSGDGIEDLERDERDIEAELARIGVEEALHHHHQQQQPQQRQRQKSGSRESVGVREGGFEPEPSHAERHAERIYRLEGVLRARENVVPEPSVGMANFLATVGAERLPGAGTEGGGGGEGEGEGETRSEGGSRSGSDKENQPSAVHRQREPRVSSGGVAALTDTTHAAATTDTNTTTSSIPSPTKTSRIPLGAPGTPSHHNDRNNYNNNSNLNRQLQPSPSKHRHPLHSPSKTFTHLHSTTPWSPFPLDTLTTQSPAQYTPTSLAHRLSLAAGPGALTLAEQAMTVEQWVRWRAEQGEEGLRRRCEEVVGGFEREGGRALGVLGGVCMDG
ncbi:hypothetical protein LTR08_007609 [Meristemomyces frigidus]|nr:hypothetical protein LTR08_007609 [Meristemomyces frigidus]